MEHAVVFLVWFALLVQGYHYVGYPLLLFVIGRFCGREAERQEFLPTVSLVICAFNEAGVISEKIENSLALDYPDLEIVVNTEGSTDGTFELSRQYASDGVVTLYSPERRGKGRALNDAVQQTSGDVLVLSDANAFYETQAIRRLVSRFADADVGLVTGRKTVHGAVPDFKEAAESESLYWQYENLLKSLETRLGATVAVHGEMLAVRRELFAPIPEDIVNDDAYQALHIMAQGRRVVFEEDAVCWEAPSGTMKDDLVRRQRMSAGRFQLLTRRNIWPRQPLVLFMFISHKVLRLFLPLFAILALVANVWAVTRPVVALGMWSTLAAQLVFIAFAILGLFGGSTGRGFLPSKIAAYLASGYAANLSGLCRALTVGQGVLWEKARR